MICKCWRDEKQRKEKKMREGEKEIRKEGKEERRKGGKKEKENLEKPV
jgi:hypothetical protein